MMDQRSGKRKRVTAGWEAAGSTSPGRSPPRSTFVMVWGWLNGAVDMVEDSRMSFAKESEILGRTSLSRKRGVPSPLPSITRLV